MKIAFISAKRYSFFPPDYLGRGLGGTESALVLMSKALAMRGHEVRVYNCCYKPGTYDGVEWLPIWKLQEDQPEFDVAISLRLPEAFDEFTLKAKLKAVWIHDDRLEGSGKYDAAGKINLWIAVSALQKALVDLEEHISPGHWFVTRNGLDPEIYNQTLAQSAKKPFQAIYCSAPDRGLEHLLSMWPRIKAKVPEAVLMVTGSFALWGNTDRENHLFFEKLYNTATSLPDVNLLERVSKQEVARLQAESGLMLYPSVFDEMFCISAIECLAAGTPVVAANRAALTDRITDGVDGYLIDGDPASLSFQDAFIDRTAQLFTDKKLLAQFRIAGIDKTQEFSYNEIALEWEKELKSRI